MKRHANDAMGWGGERGASRGGAGKGAGDAGSGGGGMGAKWRVNRIFAVEEARKIIVTSTTTS